MKRKASSSSNTPQSTSPACDFFMKDANLMPSSDLHPVDEKRWLDFVPAQHGTVQSGKRPNRWETILTLRNELRAQMISRHAVDYMCLLQEYGMGSAGVKIKNLGNNRANERYGSLLIDEPIGGMDENNNDDNEYDNEPGQGKGGCTLTVRPITGDGFDYWSITGGGPEIFHPMQDTTMVYLYLPIWRQSRKVEFSMQDRIFWFDDYTVTAIAKIDAVHHDAIIVVNDGLIVPVSASFWPRVLPPIDLEKSVSTCEDEDVQWQHTCVFLDEPVCPEKNKHAAIWPRNWSTMPYPRLANSMPNELGNHISAEVQDVMQLTPDEW